MTETHSKTKLPEPVAIVLIDHGSRRQESNDMLLGVKNLFAQLSSWDIVEHAHMELAEPSLIDAFRTCINNGAKTVIVSPYFLSPGRHWSEDIPRLTEEAAALFPGVVSFVAAPLGLHPGIIQASIQRIQDCQEFLINGKASCSVCEGKQTCKLIHVEE